MQVEWQVVARRATSRASKLRSLTRGEPTLTGLYEPPGPPRRSDLDAVMVAHSYLVPSVSEAVAGIPTIVDFHNLEFRHLADGRGDGASAGGPARRAYVGRQVALMRRLERAIVARSELSLFVSADELAWAGAAAPGAATMLLRSVLPRAEAHAAAAISERRDPRRGELVYVGTLTFPTNLTSLERFLARDWPAMRAASPELRLTVAGACDPSDRARLDRHPGVRALGFVSDLTEVLAGCEAVVIPFDGIAGTSLRPLFYALAGLPVIGSPPAFRGIDFPAGIIAPDTVGWVDAVRRIAGGDGAVAAAAQTAQHRARAQQDDPAPWDRLAAAVGALRRPTPAAGAIRIAEAGRA